MSGEGKKEGTALGTARTRFIDALPRKAEELAESVRGLTLQPDSSERTDDLRRKLHALFASSQVFRLTRLTDVLRDALERVDAARDSGRPVDAWELDALSRLAPRLTALANEPEGAADSWSAASEADAAIETSFAGLVDDSNALRAGAQTLSSRVPAPASRRPAYRSEPGLPSPSPRERPSIRPSPVLGSGAPRKSVSPQGGGSVAATPVINVLVVDQPEVQAQIRAALPAEQFEVMGTSDPDEALRLSRSSAPDVLLVDQAFVFRPEVDLIGRLRNDPLTDFIPVVLVLPPSAQFDAMAVRRAGADEAVTRPLDTPLLTRVLSRIVGTVIDQEGALDALGDATAAETAERVAEEIRRGIADAVADGADLRVPMGDGAEVLAAAWAAIGRVRAQLTQRSGGRVRFRDLPRRGGLAVLALTDEDAETTPADTEVSLNGRRILVVDDDPAVAWFFAGLLRGEGAEVVEASDGQEALDLARGSARPDVIISDILMPGLDGFALCRKLKRDPGLSHVPVILLSWKDDYLQRMHELHAGASGYLRKEAGSAQILARVQEVLRPRARLEAQLRTGGEVRGRLEGIGIVALVRTVAKERPSARLTVRDAWNLYEVNLRGGNLVDLTRTATHGTFARGEAALIQFLGSTAGRFTIVESDSAVRPTFHAPLEATLSRGTKRLGALLDAVSGAAMSQAYKVGLDPEMATAFVQSSPEPVRELIERLNSGEGPRQLLVDGKAAPQTLEAVLEDLARRGAIIDVRGPGGEDRIEEALRAREGGASRESNGPQPTASAPLPAAETRGAAPSHEVGEAGRLVAEVHRLGEELRRTTVLSAPFAFTDDLRPTPIHGLEGLPEDANLPHVSLTSSRDPVEVQAESVPVRFDVPPPRSQASRLPWILVGILLFVTGFLGWQYIRVATEHRGREGEGGAPSSSAHGPQKPVSEGEGAEAAPGLGNDEDAVLAGIADAGIAVGDREGLVIVQGLDETQSKEILVDGKTLPSDHGAIAIPEGDHELRVRRGDGISVRFLAVRAGHTHILHLR